MSAAVQRLYLDNGKKNPLINTTMLSMNLNALFANWVLSGYHERDFIEAAQHVATSIYGDHLLMGEPDFMRESLDEPTIRQVSDERAAGVAKVRFYDDAGNLTHTDTDSMRKVLAIRYAEWLNQGFFARDFVEAVKNESVSIYYSYSTARSLEGLGGGKTVNELLSEPFAFS